MIQGPDAAASSRIPSRDRRDPDVLSLAMRGGRIGWWSRNVRTETVEWSPELEDIFGLERGAFAGTEDAFFALVHPDDLPLLHSEIRRAVEEHADYAVEFRFRHRGGDWRWMEGRGRALYDADGRPEWLHGLGIDITERKRAQQAVEREGREIARLYEAMRRLSSTLDARSLYRIFRELASEAVPCDGLVVSSVDHARRTIRCEYLWVNGAEQDASKLPELPYQPEGGGMQTEVIRTGVPRLFADVAAKVREPGTRFFEVDGAGPPRRIRPDDEAPPKTRAALMVPLKLGTRVTGVIQVMTDGDGYGPADLAAVEALAAPLAVAAQNALLYADAERELAERRRVERALRESDEHKNAFLATLAHELRNPLAPIRNAMEVLRLKGERDPDMVWCREVIDRQVTHMARLLDDLMDVSRITHKRLELRREPVTLAAVLESALETTRPALAASGHALRVELPRTPVWLDADPVRLAQVFSNLLSNAAKYTDDAGSIAIEASVDGLEAVVTVRDTGIGIEADMLPKLFEIFSQAAPALSRAQGGLGIGLSLVKGIVELHGGEVAAHSDGEGRGSTFTVRLPVIPAPVAVASAVSTGAAEEARKRRALVVDDIRDNADTLAKVLELTGCDVRVAYDGPTAIEAAAAFEPELVLLDIGMPMLNGYEVARRLREHPAAKDAIIVALTGWGQEEDRARSRAAGFDHHLIKPVGLSAIQAILAEPVATGFEDGARPS